MGFLVASWGIFSDGVQNCTRLEFPRFGEIKEGRDFKKHQSPDLGIGIFLIRQIWGIKLEIIALDRGTMAMWSSSGWFFQRFRVSWMRLSLQAPCKVAVRS